MILHWMVAILALAAGEPGVTGAPARLDRYEDRVIVNYWKHINEIFREEAALAQPPSKAANLRYPPPRRFPFEAIEHLKAEDLLRAAEEGAREARKEMRNAPEEEINRKVEENISMALEYYPVLSASDDDLGRLLIAMQTGQKEKVLQLYLLKRCVPGMAPQSFFSDYFQRQARPLRDQAKEILENLSSNQAQDPEIQNVAIQAYYQWIVRECTDILAADPVAVEFAKTAGIPLLPEMLLRADAPRLDPKNSLQIKRLSDDYEHLARILAKHLETGSTASPLVQQTAREYLERISKEALLKDPETVRALLPPAETTNAAG